MKTRSPGRPIWRCGRLGGSIAAFVAAMSIALASEPWLIPYTSFSPDVVRLLEQSTFGPTPELIRHVQVVGSDVYWDEQVTAPMTPYPDLPPVLTTRPPDCTSTCQRDNYTLYPVQLHFYKNALGGIDQVRQRVAFALGQILVVSGLNSNITRAQWMAPYQQLLYANALGNFRQLLTDATLSPAMGSYLNMLNNKKFNTATGVLPNENYARELLQLFSIGLVMLNPDGTTQLGPDGQAIPTYDQATVEEFARVFTGWILAPAFGTGIPNYREPMVVRTTRGVEVDHDAGSKTLLNGASVEAGLSAAADLRAALDNIFNHPNVGPFIGKQLIQHLVTSNPSPAYVARVAAVFADNGSGVRGDLGAVVHQILFDDEARGDQPGLTYGHLVEPVLFLTRILRAFGATSDGVVNSFAAGMGQDVFRAPSVFNFYPPGYRIVGGNGLLGPEFRLFDSSTALARINFVNTAVFNGIAAAPPDRPDGTTLDFSPFLPLASDPNAMVNALDGLLLHRTMTATMHDTIVTAVKAVAASNALSRVKTAVYLVASSSQYQVER